MKLTRLMALVMSIALTSAPYPVHVAAQVATPGISGRVVGTDRTTPVPNACLRLRNLDTNAIVARTVAAASGSFSFSVSEPGTYVVEAVECGTDSVRAVSDALNLATVPLELTTVVVISSVVQSSFLSSTAFLVLSAASVAGITAVAVGSGGSSPAVSSPEQ